MVHELALQRSKYKHLSDDEWRWFLQQEEGRERTAEKLPLFAVIADWWYPVRLSCEQCSSELTARYKAQLISNAAVARDQFCDLTGGYGVDSYFISTHFAHTDFVEQDAELCRIAKHNFGIEHPEIDRSHSVVEVHHSTAEEFLTQAGMYDVLFIDPARRDSHGGKVFRLADCSPNISALLPLMTAHLNPNGQILIKLSPMIDITQAIKELRICDEQETIRWDVHVVAVKNEVKEVLMIGSRTEDKQVLESTITAIDLVKPKEALVFTQAEEHQALSSPYAEGSYLYEPNAAIMKAGAYKLVGQRYGVSKLDVHTHLYCSTKLVANFPGRVWKILPTPPLKGSQANVVARNYPLTAVQLKKKMKVQDGGERYIIGCRVNGKPTIFYAERV